MLQHAHFDSKGGFRPFAAGASQVCLSVVSRHSDNREAGFLSAMPQVGSEPILPAFCDAAKGRFGVSIHYRKSKSPLNVPKIKSRMILPLERFLVAKFLEYATK